MYLLGLEARQDDLPGLDGAGLLVDQPDQGAGLHRGRDAEPRALVTPILVLAPIAVAGVFAGVWAHTRVSDRFFFALTYALLAVTGAKLVWDALA